MSGLGYSSPTGALQRSAVERLMQRLDIFAGYTDQPGKITRLYLSRAHREAAATLTQWMAAAGMSAAVDPIGNVVGRYEGSEPNARALLIGSHIDTVRDAGRYDGNFGVLAGLTCIEEFAKAGTRFPFAIEVIAFGDEEGVRFPSALTGSRAMAGEFDPNVLDGRDESGVSLREALVAFGGDPLRIGAAARRPQDVIAYIELHIEQGPVLEASHAPIGIVTAISGASRFEADVIGTAGHAGTAPMNMRADALTGAAEMILAIEALAQRTPTFVATVGEIEVLPGSVNVVPGEARFTIDLRAPTDDVRERAAEVLATELSTIANRRGLRIVLKQTHQASAAPCDDRLIKAFSRSVTRAGLDLQLLPSGAGHDAMAMARLCPMGMLFVRCAGGISHSPAESITVEDAGCALGVLMDFVVSLDEQAFPSPEASLDTAMARS